MSAVFDVLVASRSPLPPADECERLRVAHGLTPDEVAAALKVRRAPVSGREAVKKTTEPRGPEREAYARLLNKLDEPAASTPPARAPAAVREDTPMSSDRWNEESLTVHMSSSGADPPRAGSRWVTPRPCPKRRRPWGGAGPG
ncbi:hypothetical protein [Streptomyces griseofuscus]|uniref:hypothetical protein n=1 Tax=Streptomyces griseofuscus TaxID=146922 RepID=UPI003F4D8B3F